MATTLIYYGWDGMAAKALADVIRAAGGRALVRDVRAFNGEAEKADLVKAMGDVEPKHLARLKAVYGQVYHDAPKAPAMAQTPPVANGGDLSGLSDTELRAFIRERTGTRPGPRTSRDNLIAQFKAAGGI